MARLWCRLGGGLGAVVVCVCGGAGIARAASVSLCVPSTAGRAVVSGACVGSGTTVALPSSSTDQERLISILPHIRFSSSGVDGKPTVTFSGVNVQIVNGAGSTSSINGTGNLVLGYDENPGARKQTGSHDLILGQRQSFTGVAELLDGYSDTATGSYATALGYSTSAAGAYSLTAGDQNVASGAASTAVGGLFNKAAGRYSSVTGGCSNLVGAGSVSEASICTDNSSQPHSFASITGGLGNQASGIGASVSGGHGNVASGPYGSWIGGGYKNAVPGQTSAIAGGQSNAATGANLAILGGVGNVASGTYSTISGGEYNTTVDTLSSIAGGCLNYAGPPKTSNIIPPCNSTGLEAILGGRLNSADGYLSSIAGGALSAATDSYGTILGGCRNLTGTGSLPPEPGCDSTGSEYNSVSGGERNAAQGLGDSVLGANLKTLDSTTTDQTSPASP